VNPDKRAAIIAALREERSRHTGLYSVWLFDEVEGFAMTCDDPELLSRVRSLAINLRPDLVDAFWAILRIVAPDGLPRLDVPRGTLTSARRSWLQGWSPTSNTLAGGSRRWIMR